MTKKFTLIVPKEDIAKAENKIVTQASQEMTVKGFRKGKAPLDIVKANLDPTKVTETIIRETLPQVYLDYVKKSQLHPITSPKISVKKAAPEQDWEFDIEIAEKPEVKLNDYKKEIRGEKAKSAIWTPGKEEKSENEKETEDKKITAIFDNLLKTSQVEIPDLLIEEEVNRALSKLLDQINRLGLSLEDYLASMNTSGEKLRQEYAKTAETNLKLEFILEAIAQAEKIDATDKEYQDFLKTITSDEQRQQIEKDPYAQASIRASLARRKVIDFLISL